MSDSEFEFLAPATLSLSYGKQALPGTLTLQKFADDMWQDMVGMCNTIFPTGAPYTYTVDTEAYRIDAPLCDLSEFALLAQEGYLIYLPLVLVQ